MRHFKLTALTLLLLFIVFPLFAQPANAGTISADSYEPNNTLSAASTIPSVTTLPDLTIYPAGDIDVYRFLAVPGTLTLTAYATPGIDLELTIYDANGTPLLIVNDPGSPNSAYKVPISTTGYFAFSLRNGPSNTTGSYQLQVSNTAPTATPTVAPTATTQPTSTPPYPTLTPTPNLGGTPDFAEPNFSFNTAFRIAPGTEVKNLNFNSGNTGQQDNDFFVMAVRAGIAYSCKTKDLGPNLDTNLIIYTAASFGSPSAGNDDEDTAAGLINSRVDFTPTADGDYYLLVGYKYPATEDLRYPGAATYTLLCDTNQPPAPAPVSNVSGGLGITGAQATPLSITLFSQPQPTATPTTVPLLTTTIDVVIAYDANTDRKADPSEGVLNLIVQVIDITTNQQIGRGITNSDGAVRITVATNHSVRVTIPYLAAAQDFQPGGPATWIFLVPPANVPGLIP